jgi:dihydrofolate reductase
MRRIIVQEMITVDGFFAGPNGEIDWHVVDDEFNEYAIATLDTTDAHLYGRVTFEGMVSYWPTPVATTNDPVVADKMNTTPKYVFSQTLGHAEWGTWNNAHLLQGDMAAETERLKQQPGKDIFIFGSGSIVSALTRLGLVDEYRLFVNPVVLGSGRPLFTGMPESFKLRLVSSRQFGSGNVLLTYVPVRA